MADIKLVCWNMEWMNDLFGPNDLPPAFKADESKEDVSQMYGESSKAY